MNKPWPTVRLGEVLRPVPRPVNVRAEDLYREIGIRSHGKGVFHKPPISGLELGSKKVFWVEPGDFVLNIVFAWEGAVGVLTEAEKGMIGSHRFPTFRADEDRLDARFLLHFFKTPLGVEMLGRVSPGGAGRNRTLSRKRFLQLTIPLPPLSEQRRVVARIEALAAQIHEAQTLRQEAAAKAEAIIISHHIQLARNRTRRLGEFIRLDEDSVEIRADGSYPQVGVKSFGRGLFPKAAISGADTTYRAFNRLFDGALVLSQVKGWEGAVAVCPRELSGWFVSPEYRTFRCLHEESIPGYLAAVVRTQWFWVRLTHATRGVGARRERTRPDRFLDIEIPMPDVQSQALGKRVFAEVEALKRLQSETAAELDALLPAVLDRAFKGEL